MSLGDMRQQVLEAFKKQTGKNGVDAWPIQLNCWRIEAEDGEWYTATVHQEVAR